MNLVTILQFLFFGIAFVIAIIMIIYTIKQDDGIDYDKWIIIYREEKDTTLEKIDKGNKLINKIEDEIREYKKRLNIPLFKVPKNKQHR